MSMSRTEPDPLLDFCSEEDGTAARVAARWQIPERSAPRTRPPVAPWLSSLKSELAGLPASETMTGIAILSAVVFVGAFALMPWSLDNRAVAVQGSDIPLSARKAIATTGGTPAPESNAAASHTERGPSTTKPVPSSPSRAAAPAGPVAGWLSVAGPANSTILEDGQMIGSTAVPRIMLPAGVHHLVVVNKEFGYNESATVDIQPGQTATVKLAPPRGRVNINARPWANVVIDGRKVGQTPLAAVSLPVGRHEVVFWHPQFGERRETVIVTPKGVGHVGVDFTR